MQVSFIMSLAALAAFSSAQAEKYSYGHAETAVKAVNPDLDDAAASEAASGYMHALAQLGDIGTDTDPKIAARGGCCHCCGINSGRSHACFNAAVSLGLCCIVKKDGHCFHPA
ncbi:hypothetical protein NQ176_g5040 [Zarea fungicola]|uniref:Uncharacterized protein n=1 Tax=Zarea fungicola TaxID=93591 RepID=A0ACC1NB87_9HYPO|nr:hypothetical protein NQ176_g5040 [Lecanicillium fungicola]